MSVEEIKEAIDELEETKENYKNSYIKLKDRMNNAAKFIRKNSYSITKDEEKQVKMIISQEKWDSLIKLLEGSLNGKQ